MSAPRLNMQSTTRNNRILSLHKFFLVLPFMLTAVSFLEKFYWRTRNILAGLILNMIGRRRGRAQAVCGQLQ